MNNISYQIYIISTLCLLTLAPVLNISAQTTQQGKVILQNSGFKTLPGTQIIAYGAQPVDAGHDGKFKLNFTKGMPGDLATIKEAHKKNYELVNRKELECWTLSHEQEMVIVMAPAGQLKEAREKYYAVGNTTYLKRYERTLEEINKYKKAKNLTEKEYADRMEAAYIELENSLKLLDEYADVFSRVNKDDLTEVEQQGFALLGVGKIDEAIAIYENQKLLDQIEDNISRKEKLAEDLKTILPSLKRYAEICIFAGGKENLDKAAEIYETIAKTDMTHFDNLFEYGMFLQKKIAYEESVEWLGYALKAAPNKQDIAKVYLGMGESYRCNKKFSDSENAFKKCIALYEDIQKTNGEPRLELSEAYSKLSTLYVDMNEFKKGNEAIVKGLEVNSLFSAIGNDSILVLSYKAGLLAARGMLLDSKKNEDIYAIDSSLVVNSYQESIDLYKHLVSVDSIRFISQLSLVMRNFGMYYLNFGMHLGHERIKRCEQYLLESLHIEEQLYVSNPYITEPILARIYGNLAVAYNVGKKNDLCVEFNMKALEITQRLSEYNPSAFMANLSLRYLNLGYAYGKIGRYEEAIDLYQKSLRIFNDLPKEQQDALSVNIISTYSSLGEIYQKKEEYIKSIEYFLQAESVILSLLPKSNFTTIYLGIASSLAFNYLKVDNFSGWSKYSKLEMKQYIHHIEQINGERALTQFWLTKADKLTDDRYVLYREECYKEALLSLLDIPAETLSDPYLVYYYTLHIGDYYLGLKKYDKALRAFLLFQELAPPIETLSNKKDKLLYANSYYQIGLLSVKIGKQNEFNKLHKAVALWNDMLKSDTNKQKNVDYMTEILRFDNCVIYSYAYQGAEKWKAGYMDDAEECFRECIAQLEILEIEKGSKANIDIDMLHYTCNTIRKYYEEKKDQVVVSKISGLWNKLVFVKNNALN